MRPILMPARAIARSADCAPGPGVFVLLPPVARSLMCTAPMPSSCGTRMLISSVPASALTALTNAHTPSLLALFASPNNLKLAQL